ncbi:MAG: hypothetical protein Q8K24_05990 [Hydrogenophaga sp.]|nr:hypothetical protein [Hydrogenophaga sp.]
MPEHHDHLTPVAKTIINWLAAILGVGTFAQIVPVLVGVLSAAWIAVQLYGYLRYDLPAKRAKLARLTRPDAPACDTDMGAL